MIFEAALFMAFGAVVIFLKLPLCLKRFLMRFQLFTDVAVTYGMFVMHSGGVTGTMSAAISGAMFGAFIAFYTVLWKARHGEQP